MKFIKFTILFMKKILEAFEEKMKLHFLALIILFGFNICQPMDRFLKLGRIAARVKLLKTAKDRNNFKKQYRKLNLRDRKKLFNLGSNFLPDNFDSLQEEKTEQNEKEF